MAAGRSNLGRALSSTAELWGGRLGRSETVAVFASRLMSSESQQLQQVESRSIKQHPTAALQTEQNKLQNQQEKEQEHEQDGDGVHVNKDTGEIGGPRGPEPTRFGDWERNGRCSDF